MRPPQKAAVVVFARRPELNRVKTRLVPPLTPEQALELHVACLQSTGRLVASLPASIDKWLYLTGRNRAQASRSARQLALAHTFAVRLQRGRDLGARLRRAFTELLGERYERVVVLGSDSPTLSRGRLRQAVAALERADAVIGPAGDGGYYLIGLRTGPAGLPPVFHGIDWGTELAFNQTLTRLKQAGRRARVLPPEHDVDTAADLRRLGLELRRRTAETHLRPLRTWFSRRERARANRARRRPGRGRDQAHPRGRKRRRPARE